MKECTVCSENVNHLKKHMKKNHPQEYKERFINSITNRKVPKIQKTVKFHTCPVTYLQNFAHLNPSFQKKLINFTDKTYRDPKRNEYQIYAYNKIEKSKTFCSSINKIPIKKRFYSEEIDKFIQRIERKAGRAFHRIRSLIYINSFNIHPIYDFIMTQLVRTPKFQNKIKRDLEFRLNMDDEEYKMSLSNLALVRKPQKLTNELVRTVQESIIKSNRLLDLFKWSKITMVHNFTKMPFITSDSPVLYNQLDFLPSEIPKLNRIEPSLIFNKNALIAFPLSPNFFIIIKDFDKNRKRPLIHYENINSENQVLTINTLIYKFSERFVFMKERDDNLIKLIQNNCKGEFDIEYLTHEIVHRDMEEEVRERLK